MLEKRIEMRSEDIDSLFKEKLGDDLNQSLLDALYDLLPQISAYKEEDKTFSFKIAIGKNFRSSGQFDTGFYKIKKYTIVNDAKIDCGKIKEILKQTAIFCTKNADMYINLLGSDEIEFGVYYVELERTGVVERLLLCAKVILLEGFSHEGIRMLSFNK